MKDCEEAAARGEVSLTQRALSLRRLLLTGPAGNMFKESSVCSQRLEMCKTPTEGSRESARKEQPEAPSRKQVGSD